MARYSLTEPAVADLEDIRDYIARDSPAFALRHLARLKQVFASLAEVPGQGRFRPELGSAVQSFPVGNYLIFYQQVDGDILILRVIHAARDFDTLIS